MTFRDYTTARLGSRNWVVARKTPSLASRYDVFMSQARYDAIQKQHEIIAQQRKEEEEVE